MQHLVSYGRSVFLKKGDFLFLNFLPDAELGVLVDKMPCEVKGMAALDGQHLLICKLYSPLKYHIDSFFNKWFLSRGSKSYFSPKRQSS